MADLVVSEGYAAAGYQYINVDDCWLDKQRSYSGHLQPDPERFPFGMKDLSAYVRSSILRMGYQAKVGYRKYVFVYFLP